MLSKIVFLLFPVVLSATKLCEGDECNVRNARIVGGEATEQFTRPFQVALYMRVGTTGDLGFCGGSLVHQEWVLTAAHCCFHDGREVDHVQAILGAFSLYDRYENGRRIVNVNEVVVHPDWDPNTFANDIALLKLANIVQIGTDAVDVVRLPYRSMTQFNFAGQGAIVSGWGIGAEGVTFISPTLRQRLMSVTTDLLCNNYYLGELPENTICSFMEGSGTCKGDNGGPMTIFNNATEETLLNFILMSNWTSWDPSHIFRSQLGKIPVVSLNSPIDTANLVQCLYRTSKNQIGVASFVSATGCNDELPSVFTRTQRYLDWISEVTGLIID